MFLTRALMPLHKPKCVAMYHQQLAYCVTQVRTSRHMVMPAGFFVTTSKWDFQACLHFFISVVQL